MKTKSPKPTKAIVLKILDLLSYGLVSGLGEQKPGKMCVEAAICFAYGLPHGDEPPCVGRAVRDFKVRLNDCNWPSNEDRAEGMKGLAIAQLGSDELDQMAFGKLIFLRGTQILLPFVFRKEAANLPESKRGDLIEHADKCAGVKTFEDAKEAARYAYAYASAYASAYAYAHASASAYAYASAYASAYAYASAHASAYAYAYAYASAHASAYRHELLTLTAKVGLDVLIEMKSPGCKFLKLVTAKAV